MASSLYSSSSCTTTRTPVSTGRIKLSTYNSTLSTAWFLDSPRSSAKSAGERSRSPRSKLSTLRIKLSSCQLTTQPPRRPGSWTPRAAPQIAQSKDSARQRKELHTRCASPSCPASSRPCLGFEGVGFRGSCMSGFDRRVRGEG